MTASFFFFFLKVELCEDTVQETDTEASNTW